VEREKLLRVMCLQSHVFYFCTWNEMLRAPLSWHVPIEMLLRCCHDDMTVEQSCIVAYRGICSKWTESTGLRFVRWKRRLMVSFAGPISRCVACPRGRGNIAMTVITDVSRE
jgi:hypothetical protein